VLYIIVTNSATAEQENYTTGKPSEPKKINASSSMTTRQHCTISKQQYCNGEAANSSKST
jgi:hypothetical protein